MLDILNKFENIKIENDTRISQEDKQFCKEQQEQYIKASTIYNQMINQFCNLTGFPKEATNYYDIKSKNKYLDQYLLKDLKEKLNNIKNAFIGGIVWHFVEKYNVTIESEKIKSKYGITVTYDNIINEIFEQLGGMTFTEKANNEIIEAMKKTVDGRWQKVEVKNKKIKIDSFFYIDSFDKKWGHNRVSYNSDKEFDTLLTALSNFEYGVTHNCMRVLYNTITNKEDDEIFKVHELIFSKINSLKLYKNGKIEIEFANSQYAEQFAKEYCNYSKVA